MLFRMMYIGDIYSYTYLLLDVAYYLIHYIGRRLLGHGEAVVLIHSREALHRDSCPTKLMVKGSQSW